eukprot:1152295-Alexandrium_andersonii.AAC.1
MSILPSRLLARSSPRQLARGRSLPGRPWACPCRACRWRGCCGPCRGTACVASVCACRCPQGPACGSP